MSTLTPRLPLVLLLAAPLACGDDGGTPTSTTDLTVPTNPTMVDPTTGASTVPGSSTGDTTPTTSDGTTMGSNSGSSSTVDPTTAGETTVDPTGDTTDGTTTAVSASSSSSGDFTSTGGECVCEPGTTNGCDQGDILTCNVTCDAYAPVPCPQGQSCFDGACQAKLCTPNEVVCDGVNQTKQCNAQGDGFGPPTMCGATQECSLGACTELCELIKSDPSSVGCVFRGNKMQNFQEEPSAVTVGNVSKTLTAKVTMYFYENGAEQVVTGPVDIAPGKSAQFDLLKPPQPGTGSTLRANSTFKIVSTVPVVAYLHSPIKAMAHNDSSMLLPDHAQQKNYIIPAYAPNVGGNPAYFNVIGLVDGTEVSWTPPVATLAGGGVPGVAAGQTGKITVGDYDLLQVSAGQADLSGTIVSLSQPAWVVGAVQCVRVPAGADYCDHIEEQAIPLEYWGDTYVGAHAPKRGNENYWWRVYAGDDNVTITTTPAQPGFPVTLNKGKFIEFKTKDSLLFEGTGPIMPVQYLESQNAGAGTGDPAMYQMVPVEQFLDRYVFVTGIGYNLHYVQVVRDKGGADVLVDGVVVNGYYTVGNYEVADWKIGEGTHLAESTSPFGIYQVGYTAVTSYAYPGGLRLKVINPQ